MTDKVDNALQELAEFAADSWSNSAIVDQMRGKPRPSQFAAQQPGAKGA